MNNNASNLCYGTAKENAQDKVIHGHSARGLKNPKNKLSETQVKEIQGLYGIASAKDVALRFALNPSTIYRIWNKKYWSHA